MEPDEEREGEYFSDCIEFTDYESDNIYEKEATKFPRKTPSIKHQKQQPAKRYLMANKTVMSPYRTSHTKAVIFANLFSVL